MTMTPRLRKFALTAHITSSVGWLGAVACFLALAVAGLNTQDTEMVRAVYLAMALTGWCVIVPLSLASPLTGIVQSLGTSWGLFRHYWVAVKLVITVPATALLLLHIQPIGHLARVVSEATLARGELGGMRVQLVANAGAALFVLLVATTLSVYKPRGMTRYGRRKQDEERQRPVPTTPNREATRTVVPPLHPDSRDDTKAEAGSGSTTGTRWGLYVLLGIIGLALLFVIIHLAGGGMGGH